MSGDTWIVSPVYFDVPSFLVLADRLREVAERDPHLAERDLRFVVLDDSAGRDPDVERLRELRDVEVVEPPFNLGHQRGLVYALRTIAPEVGDDDLVVTLDSDGEDRPEDLPRLVAPVLADEGRGKIALALRTRRRETLVFRLFYAFFKVLFRALTGASARTGNYAAYRGHVAKTLLGHPYFDLCYSSTLTTLNIPVEFVRCERGDRYAGESRMSYWKLFTHGLTMLMPFTERIAVRALLTFSVTMALAIVGSLIVIGVRLFSDLAIPGWATSTLLLLILLSFVALGNFVVLFAVIAQARGTWLAKIEEADRERARVTSSPAG